MEKNNSSFSPKKQPLSGILSPCQEKEAARKYGFTLVELIVVITILAILGTIAFISLQGYSKDARDSVRISDISKIKTSLELFQLDAGKYPETTDYFTVTYSGATAWTQGTFGETTYSNVSKLDKIPTDPVTDRKYVYSVTNTKQEYQIAGVMEGEEVTSIFNKTNAAQKIAMLKISGNYNGKVLKVSTGSIDYVLAVPSIITSSGFTLEEIVAEKFLAYNGYKNLPAQYTGSSYEILGDEEINLVNSADLVVFSGSLATLSSSESAGITARKSLIETLKSAYSGTAITGIGEIAQIINTNTEDDIAIEFLGATIVSNNLGGSVTASAPTVKACTIQPEYTGATFEIGIATEPNQAWQSSDENAPCYWTCGAGKVLDENSCVSETCAGITPDGTAKVSNSTSFAGGTWSYNTTPGKCTYSCGTGYHTEDGGTSCISDIKNCAITNGIGEQTWNGTSWGICTLVSCTGGYTGTNCEIAPKFIGNCTANGQIYYSDNNGNKLAIVTNAGVATWVSGKSTLDLTCAGNIILCSGNNAGYVIQTCNIGSTTVGITPSSYGNRYQFGKSTTTWTIGNASYSYDWKSPGGVDAGSANDWGVLEANNKTSTWLNSDATSRTKMQGPCNAGYHVPTNAEWVAIVSAGGWTMSGINGTNMMNTLKMPFTGGRGWNDSVIYDQGTYGYYWLSSTKGVNAYNLYFGYNFISPSYTRARAIASSIRCLKN